MSFLNLPSRLCSPFAALWKSLSTACVDLCFPPLCIHCKEVAEYPLCPHCFQLLEFSTPLKKCHNQLAFVFERQGPAITLAREFAGGLRPALAPAMAGFMLLQLDKFQWPLPDIVLPLPSFPFDLFDKSYLPNPLLAESLRLILKCPKTSSKMGKNILCVATSSEERKARHYMRRLEAELPAQVRTLLFLSDN